MRPTRLLLLFLLAALAPTAAAQTLLDTLRVESGWHSELVGSLNLSQAAFVNWQEGGLNSLAATAGTRGRFARSHGRIRQLHDFRLALGIVQQDTLAPRKATDVIRHSLSVQYAPNGPWRPTLAWELRTQFASGFDYDPTPQRYPALAELIVPGQRLKVSGFFAPAVWTQSAGVTYDPETWFTARAGLALKNSIVTLERLRPVYGNALDEPWRVEAGLDALVEARGEPFPNVRVQSRLSMFQAFIGFTDGAPDALWENTVQLRVNDWLGVDLEAAALYDRDVSARVQFREVLSVGLTLTIL